MLAMAPRPAVRADGCRLPITGSSVDAVTTLYTLYHYDEPREPVAEARRTLRPDGLFVASAPYRSSYPELAGVVPGWRSRSHSTQRTPRPWSHQCSTANRVVQIDRSDGPLVRLADVDERPMTRPSSCQNAVERLSASDEQIWRFCIAQWPDTDPLLTVRNRRSACR